MNYFLLALLGSVAGIFSGMFGLGGAVVVVPALVYVFGLSQHTAQGTSLAMLLPPIGLLAVMRYYKSGQINFVFAVILAISFFISAYLGAHLAVNVPETLMKRLFGGALIAIGVFMLSGK